MTIKCLTILLFLLFCPNGHGVKDIQGRPLYTIVEKSDSQTQIVYHSEYDKDISCMLFSLDEANDKEKLYLECKNKAVQRNLFEIDGLTIYHGLLLDRNRGIIESRVFRFAPKYVKPLSDKTVSSLEEIGYEIKIPVNTVNWSNYNYCFVVMRVRYEID